MVLDFSEVVVRRPLFLFLDLIYLSILAAPHNYHKILEPIMPHNVVALLSFAMLFSLLTVTAGIAQSDCNDACQAAWGAVLTKTTSIFQPPSQCTVKITYRTREACSIFEFQIVKIEVIGSCGASPFALISGALRNLLQGPTTGFPTLAAGECRVDMQAALVVCWGEATLLGVRTVIPCSETQCCYGVYQICGTASGVNTVIPVGTPGGAGTCSTNGCVPMCMALGLPF